MYDSALWISVALGQGPEKSCFAQDVACSCDCRYHDTNAAATQACSIQISLRYYSIGTSDSRLKSSLFPRRHSASITSITKFSSSHRGASKISWKWEKKAICETCILKTNTIFGVFCFHRRSSPSHEVPLALNCFSSRQ